MFFLGPRAQDFHRQHIRPRVRGYFVEAHDGSAYARLLGYWAFA